MQFFGTPGKWEQRSTQTPQQQQVSNQFLQQLGPLFEQILKPVDRTQTMAERVKAYRTGVAPSIIDSAGGGPTAQGQRGSSLFSAIAGGEKQLQESLAAMQEGFQENDRNRMQGLFGSLANIGFQPQFQNVYTKPTQGFIPNFLNNAGSFAGKSAGIGSLGALSGLAGLLGGRSQGDYSTGQQQNGSGNNNIMQLLQLLSMLQQQQQTQY